MTFALETLLVTGFPGFHARKLVLHLLAVEPELRLVLLCRASDRERSAEYLSRLEPSERARVSEVIGDPAALDFGLSGAEYLELAGSVQRVYHFASVLEAKRRTDAAAHNIACAREVLEFAQVAPKLRGLILLSSVTVCGTRTGLILEDELNCGQTFRRRLDESLATVEAMFARRGQLPQIVLRPAQIVGDSQSGEIDSPGFPYPWLAFVARGPNELVVPVPHRPDAPVQIVPIDFVVRTAHFLATRPEAYGKRYHLVDPEPPTLKEFLQLAAAACGKHLAENFNPGAFTRGLAAKPGLRMLTQGARGLFDLFVGSPVFDTKNAQHALGEGGITCPPVASYLNSLLDRARAGAAAHEVEPLEAAAATAEADE
ncbi:MAG TPA: SDR family oxidoreductase [Polyangiaceae bacterium]|nr:SDR family oxidoreductase [Polyangiaceae bacterium]